MPALQQRLASILSDVVSVEQESDGALTVRHGGTFASLRVVNIAEGLELVSLTQIVAWDLPLTRRIRERAAKQARDVNFGGITVLEKDPDNGTAKGAGKTVSKIGDVMLRYNFPGAGLGDDALRTLILLVLDTGARVREALIAGAP
ncbi:hypothetical protein B1987_03975 [Mycobacterium kansasii]|uniref:Uncharacterized protein n=1 Tax=Mycobacterium attenuatum TaxID=2341086 RepID=A0A498Q7T0_9MYCO|nr:hypothetical protein [Mycobacterium attenuatum]ORB83130.1 hypothetical protein B1987_03975 [Mycobacterium kansasii]VBA40622.1 hypothetical protein LAUMK136_03606 [Mycobacterium attenuatum]VBA59840.1 hypothetical protein LAUMK41_03697 [Mycobacterium attenuatum]